MNRAFLIVVGLCVFLSVGSVADAQYLRVGPPGPFGPGPFGGVSVRGPFGGVDVGPFGGVSVRTPFGSYSSGVYGYRSYRPYYGYRYGYYPPSVSVYGVAPQLRYRRAPLYTTPVVPLVPGPYDIGARDYVYPVPNIAPAVPNYRAARPDIGRWPASVSPDQLRMAAETLKRNLSRRPDDADVWLDYLAPQRIIDAIDAGEPPGSLRDVLANYEGVSGNSTLGFIWSTPGFRQTHQLLGSYVQSAPLPQQYRDSTEELEDVPPPEPTPAVPIRPADGEVDENQGAVPEPVSLLEGVAI